MLGWPRILPEHPWACSFGKLLEGFLLPGSRFADGTVAPPVIFCLNEGDVFIFEFVIVNYTWY